MLRTYLARFSVCTAKLNFPEQELASRLFNALFIVTVARFGLIRDRMRARCSFLRLTPGAEYYLADEYNGYGMAVLSDL